MLSFEKEWVHFMTCNKQNKSSSQHRNRIKNVNLQKSWTKQKHEEKESLFRNVVKKLSRPTKFDHFLIATSIAIMGFGFNSINEMPMFWLKVLFVYALYIFLSYTIIYIEQKNNDLKIELTGDPQLVKCQKDYRAKSYSNFNFILCFFACIYFVAISIILEFVKINLIGLYCLFALSYIVFVAFIIFQQYIFILSLLGAISKISPGNFYELIPEKTEWFKLLEKFSNTCRNLFMVLGSLFILLFMLFSPINSIQIIFQEKLSSPQFIPLLCTWIIILIAIVFMVPFSSLARNILLQKIYNNLIAQSIENYNTMFKTSNSNNKVIYMDIILRLYDRRYTLQNSYTWVIPVFVSIINFASIVISIIVDLKDLKLLT